MNPKRFAVIDIGTNSVKCLLVSSVSASASPGVPAMPEITVDDEWIALTRLGEGLSQKEVQPPEVQPQEEASSASPEVQPPVKGGPSASENAFKKEVQPQEVQPQAERLIKPIPFERTLAKVQEFYEAARGKGAGEILMIGTWALREAENREAFAERLRKATGVSLRVLSPEEEARYTYWGAVNSLQALLPQEVQLPEVQLEVVPPQTDTPRGCTSSYLGVLNIGGGSTELAFGRFPAGPASAEEVQSQKKTAGGQPPGPEHTLYFPLGGVVLKERFLTQDPVDEGEYRRMVDWIWRTVHFDFPTPGLLDSSTSGRPTADRQLATASPLTSRPLDSSTSRLLDPLTSRLLVGVGGTLTTLSEIIPYSGTHKKRIAKKTIELTLPDINRFNTLLRAMTIQQRAVQFKIPRQRADIMVPGLALLEVILDKLKQGKIWITPHGMRYGLAWERVKESRSQPSAVRGP